MPAPRPTRSPRGNRPVPSTPPLRTHARPSASPATTSSNAKRPRPAGIAGRAQTSEPFVPLTSETGRLPAYSHVSGEAYLQRLARVKALLNQRSLLPQSPYNYFGYGNSYGTYGNYAYWNPYDSWGMGYGAYGFWGSPLFFGGLYCDPFNAWFCYGPSPYTYLTAGFGFPYFYGFSYSLFPVGSLFSPFYPNMFQLFSADPCPSCTGLLSFGFDSLSPFSPWIMPGGSSLDLSSGLTTLSGTESTVAADSLFASASTASSVPLYRANTPPPGLPVTLVFTNGKSVQATQYWLSKGQLYYVTAMGVRKSVPLQNFNMSATMKVNQQNGVNFFLPLGLHAQPQSQKP
jgi:hypothetical protein